MKLEGNVHEVVKERTALMKIVNSIELIQQPVDAICSLNANPLRVLIEMIGRNRPGGEIAQVHGRYMTVQLIPPSAGWLQLPA